jgi:transcriptional regulator with XRE-family HTH domain
MLPKMRHHEVVPYDYKRLAHALRDARSQLGITQAELAKRAGVYVSTIQNLEGRRTPKEWPQSIGAVERELGKPEGWARGVAEVRSPAEPTSERTSVSEGALPQGVSLIDPESDDPTIRELSVGPVAGGDEFREQLIRLYLDSLAEEERQSRRRAALRVLRLAAASLGKAPQDAELERKLDRLEAIESEIDHEDKPQNSDIAGQPRSTA